MLASLFGVGALQWQSKISYSFEKDLASRLARMCKVVYATQPEALFQWRCPTCVKYLSEFTPESLVRNEQTGGRAIVGYDSLLNAVVVAFRGNSNQENWLNSLNIDKVPPESIVDAPQAGEAHEGFLTIYESLRSAVLEAVEEVLEDHPGAAFRIAGHSMGGTQAILLALDLQQKYPRKDMIVYNFGSPRVGDSTFTRYYNQRVPKTIRVVHTADPVIFVPPSVWPFSYEHVGNDYLDESKYFSHRVYLGIHLTKVGKVSSDMIIGEEDEEDDDEDGVDVQLKLSKSSTVEKEEMMSMKNAKIYTEKLRRKDMVHCEA